MIAMSLAMLKAYPRKMFLRQVAQRTSIKPDVREYVLEVSSRMPHARVVEVMDALTRGAIAPDPDWRVPVPTLLLCGTEDKLASIRKELPAWAEVDDGCRFAWVPDAGHASNQDNPQAFNALLLPHLERVLQKASQ
jgi:pimeloyl-ACP methyl ester carboxylesterase